MHDQITGTHAPRGVRASRNLSVAQEGALIDKINGYAIRSTLLTPRHITQLAEEVLCEHSVGCNLTSTFIRRHSDRITSNFWRVQELARLKADNGNTTVKRWIGRSLYPSVEASVIDTGYANSATTIQWLIECFDPATRARANGARRLLFLD